MAMQVCSPWTTPDRLCCEGAGTTTDCDGVSSPLVYEWTDEDYILAASNILFAKTCFLFPGICNNQVWPCLNCCSCKRHPCSCVSYSYIELPTDYEVIEINSVEIDGVPVDPAAYRIERRNILVRIDGERWPCRNGFGLPNSTAPEVIVDYDHGRVPPIELQMAAGELACHLKKACNGGECDLPPYVTSILRRGVEINLMDLSKIMKTGSTGLPMVDHAVSIHTPCSHTKMFDPAKGMRGWQVS